MSYATLRYAVADTGVATIAMDQPDTRNALSDELLSDLIAAFEARARRRRRALRRAHLHPPDDVQRAAATSAASRPTSRSCTSISPPSASRGCSR